MIINGNEYKTILLDTNALHTLATSKDFARKLMQKFCIDNTYIFCFSIYNLIELRPKTDLYEKIIEFFNIIPCFLFSPYKCIINEEYKAYMQNKPLEINNNFAWAFSPLRKDLSFGEWLSTLIDTNEQMVQTIESNIKELPGVAKSWEAMRSPKDLPANQFKKIIKLQESKVINVFLQDVLNLEDTQQLNTEKFPGARVMLFSQTQRVHFSKKSIVANDVMDVEISTVVPYVDAVLTEKSQAEIYKKAKTKINELAKLEIYKLSDIHNLKED